MGAPEEVISVAELDRRLKRAVEGATAREWVEGEIGSLKRAASGHVYFTLKDEREDAVIDCVMYRFNAQRARRILEEGARVQLLGRATLWAPRGRLQFSVDRARPAGRGALLEALEKLKQRLSEEGVFAVERKRALPAEPRIVGVVTSSAGAAFHDICTVAFRRGGARIVLSPAQVQGEGAPDSILGAIDLIERYPGLEVLIVGRGGGSADDLMAFNDERVVRRVAAARVPVVSAVGHEIDLSLTDLAADVRAATPSEAAELVIPDLRSRSELLSRLSSALARAIRSRLMEDRATVSELRSALSDPRFVIAERQQDLDELVLRMERHEKGALARRRARLEMLRRRLSAQHPRAVLARARGELSPLSARLGSAIRMRVSSAGSRLSTRVAELDSLSPLAVLGRGYAIATRSDGRAIRGASDVRVGDAIEVRLHQGSLEASVTALEGAEGEPPAG